MRLCFDQCVGGWCGLNMFFSLGIKIIARTLSFGILSLKGGQGQPVWLIKTMRDLEV